MMNKYTLKICLLVTVLMGAFNLTQAAKDDGHIVVIISIDGMASYYLDDPKADIPTLHALMAEGASAKSMKPVLPTSTWANHTTLVTGVTPDRHGVIGNKYWERSTGKTIQLISDPIFDKDELVKAPTIYDVAHDAGIKTAAILWPASRNAHTLDWTIPDVGTDEHFKKYCTPELWAESVAAGIPVEKQEVWRNSGMGVERDLMYTKMFLLALKHHPGLALLHLIAVDHLEHEHGPRSPEAYAALHAADQRVKEVKAALAAQYPGKATIIVTSDHGFVGYHQKIEPNVKLRQAGLYKSKVPKNKSPAYSISQGGSCYIYINDKKNLPAWTKKIAAMFKGAEGIDLVLEPKDYAKFGLPTPDVDPRMGDLILTAKDDYSISDGTDGETFVTAKSAKLLGAHGHSPLMPQMQASFMAWGAGIKKGVKLDSIDNLDVAPTAAALLGLEMKNVQGRVLKEILE